MFPEFMFPEFFVPCPGVTLWLTVQGEYKLDKMHGRGGTLPNIHRHSKFHGHGGNYARFRGLLQSLDLTGRGLHCRSLHMGGGRSL